MPILDLSSASDQNAYVHAEFCIIGGGMAGLFIARKLAKAGRRVVVLESGSAGTEQQSCDLNRIVDVQGRYSRALDGRYRGLGGSSSRWGGRIVPIYPEDTKDRPHLNLSGWPFPYAELERHSAEIETAFGLPDGPFDEQALRQCGLDEAFAPSDPDFTGRLAKWVNFRSCNLALLWQAELAQLAGLDIWLGATVNRFELDRQKGLLRSVEARSFSGKSLKVSAERFVLAAGTIETTRLLLWLDRQSGKRAFAGCSALGRYFQDHLKAEVATIGRRNQAKGNWLFGYHYVDGARRSLHLDFTTSAQQATGTPSAFAYAAMDLSHSRLNRIKAVARGLQRGKLGPGETLALLGELPLVARMVYWRFMKGQVYMPPSVRLSLQIAVEQRPDWANHLTLSSEQDALGMPKVAVHWQPKPADEAAFRTVAERLTGYWSRSGLDGDYPLDWSVSAIDSPMAFTDRAEAYAHPSGSARMGTDPANSVVGPDLVCHKLPNLSVASAAVFPTAGSANPTFTILQLALRHAESLLVPKRVQAVQTALRAYAGSSVLTAAMAPLSASATRTRSSSSI